MRIHLAAAVVVACLPACSSDSPGGEGGSSSSTATTTSAPTATAGPATSGVGGASGQGGDATGGAGGDAPATCESPDHVQVLPPARPDGASPGAGPAVKLGIQRLFLGDTDRNGTPSPDAWKGFGFDLDGVGSADGDGDGPPDPSCHCAPTEGASAATLEDAPGGVDNSFGRNIVPILTGLAADMSAQVNTTIEQGDATWVFDLLAPTGSDVDPSGATFVDVRGGEDDIWETDPNSLDEGGEARITQDQAWVSGDTWVSAPFPELELTLRFADIALPLVIHQAVVTMDLSPDRTSADNGTIAGHLRTEELIEALADLAGSVDPSLCPPSPTFDSIATQFRQASDILAGGAQSESFTCDGITIALGFEAAVVEVGEVADPLPPPVSPCAK